MDIESEIDLRIGEVRTNVLDLTIGEIINLHNQKEFVIQPEYQRLFRWSNQQRSRLVESVLLELPIPQIFLIENSNGVLELIDGLQRISSLIQFVDNEALGLPPLKLDGCDIIKTLNEKTYSEIPLSLKLRVKRSSLRCILIRKQSKSFLRYEMFKRLNTGGAILSPQEIRNCSARMFGDEGSNFYAFLQKLSVSQEFSACTEPLSQADFEQKENEELVLRFFAAKNAIDMFRGSVRDWLDQYMEGVLFESIKFDRDEEQKQFSRVFSLIAKVMGPEAFVKHRNGLPIGALAPAYFEAVSIGTFQAIDGVEGLDPQLVKNAIINAVQSDEFKEVTGPGANSKEKMRRRIALIFNTLRAL